MSLRIIQELPGVFTAVFFGTASFILICVNWLLKKDLAEERLRVKTLNEQIKGAALKDDLTGTFNYRYMHDRLAGEFKRSKRSLEPLALMLIDVDFFKSINNAHGHGFGDYVLAEFASLIRHTVRESDIVFRYQGAEFGVLLPNTTNQEGLVVAERLHERARSYIYRQDLVSSKVTVSIGVCSYPEDAVVTKDDLLRNAQDALAKAKLAGGDRSRSYHTICKEEDEEGLALVSTHEDIEKLKEKFLKIVRRLNQTCTEAVNALASAVEAKDFHTIEHSQEVNKYASKLSRALALTQDQAEIVGLAAILHDIGKIGISEQILLKKGDLNPEEFEEIKKHPAIAVDILKCARFLEKELPLIRHHHENWDGTGYPDRLARDQIPLGARIIAIADNYAALLSDRSYRSAYTKTDAINMIKKEKGKRFDPKLTDVFIDLLSKEDFR